jgi:hypothetical protein
MRLAGEDLGEQPEGGEFVSLDDYERLYFRQINSLGHRLTTTHNRTATRAAGGKRIRQPAIIGCSVVALGGTHQRSKLSAKLDWCGIPAQETVVIGVLVNDRNNNR